MRTQQQRRRRLDDVVVVILITGWGIWRPSAIVVVVVVAHDYCVHDSGAHYLRTGKVLSVRIVCICTETFSKRPRRTVISFSSPVATRLNPDADIIVRYAHKQPMYRRIYSRKAVRLLASWPNAYIAERKSPQPSRVSGCASVGCAVGDSVMSVAHACRYNMPSLAKKT